VALALMLALGVLAVACGEDEPATPTTGDGATTTAAAVPTDVLKIGAMVSLSTPQGLEMQKWLTMFAKV